MRYKFIGLCSFVDMDKVINVEGEDVGVYEFMEFV